MNVELLKRTAAYMLRYPENIDMSRWVEGTYVADKRGGPSCGTTACIAGTAWALEHGAADANDIYGPTNTNEGQQFRDLLGLSFGESERLFFVTGWPTAFRCAYHDASFTQDGKAVAQVIYDRIMHFIATDGAE